MAKPKKGVVALQAEINTEEEWQELLSQPGLILVDVYCEWSGPCTAMVSVLRKIKMEIAGDAINYAIAKNDEIEDLERFRGFSEPVWMFVENGKMVNLIFGANAPTLRKVLIAEIKRVQEGTAPSWQLSVNQRGPEEEHRWKTEQAVRKAIADKKKTEEETRKKAEYEAFMAQMMLELCEMMVVILYPWVFKDEEGNPKIKMQCAPYTELVRDLLRGIFDVQEEIRIQLDEETIKKMFVESDIEITKERVIGLTDGKCMAIRMKSRPPPPEWPVPYPNTCPDEEAKCPVRAINDVENYFHSLLQTQSHRKTIVGSLLETPRQSVTGTYLKRYEYIHEPDPEIEGDIFRIDPPMWAPYQARSKIHVFLTLFEQYMAENHPYEVPKPPPPLCAFKYKVQKFEDLRNAFEAYTDAVEYFGAFPIDEPRLVKKIASSPEEFSRKVRKPTTEVFVTVIRKINEEAFLAFAGIDPYFATEKEEEAQKIINEYFPEEMERDESKIQIEGGYYEEEEEAAHYYEADIYY
ncbi:hypothetical protein KPH14_008021 [Odynerus spinipes]|uniref:Thioredoxin domain-containing protein n=1 Tax=Odynerus spinipes TaxID=1348599 RepID=A0AAD9VNJ6_9HYME|nr:hypothetical protein KPH14_008021 [Odynerus spinipes]